MIVHHTSMKHVMTVKAAILDKMVKRRNGYPTITKRRVKVLRSLNRQAARKMFSSDVSAANPCTFTETHRASS